MKPLLEICRECGLPVRTVPAGENLIDEGLPLGAVFVLIAGKVQVLKQEIELTEVALPGAVFGEVSLLLDTVPMATVRTLRESSFYVAENAEALVASHPVLFYHIARLLAARLTSVSAYLVDLKRQFASRDDHLGMVDDVLESLLHHQAKPTARSPQGPTT